MRRVSVASANTETTAAADGASDANGGFFNAHAESNAAQSDGLLFSPGSAPMHGSSSANAMGSMFGPQSEAGSMPQGSSGLFANTAVTPRGGNLRGAPSSDSFSTGDLLLGSTSKALSADQAHESDLGASLGTAGSNGHAAADAIHQFNSNDVGNGSLASDAEADADDASSAPKTVLTGWAAIAAKDKVRTADLSQTRRCLAVTRSVLFGRLTHLQTHCCP